MGGTSFISYSDFSKAYLVRHNDKPYISVDEAKIPYLQRIKLPNYSENYSNHIHHNRINRGRKHINCKTIVEDPAEDFDKLEDDEYNFTLEGYVLIY